MYKFPLVKETEVSLEEVLTFCEPSVPRNEWRTGRLARCDVQFCVLFFFVGRHWRVPLIKEITNLRIGVFHVFSSEQMATQPIVPRVCPANFLKPLGQVYTGSTDCFGGTCITNRKPGTTEALWERARLVKWCSCCEGLRGPCLDELGIAARSRAAALLHSREGLFQGFFCSTITKFLVKKNTESSQKALTHTATCLAQLDETAALKRDDREARIVSYSYYSLRFSLLKRNSHQIAT